MAKFSTGSLGLLMVVGLASACIVVRENRPADSTPPAPAAPAPAAPAATTAPPTTTAAPPATVSPTPPPANRRPVVVAPRSTTVLDAGVLDAGDGG